MGAVADSLRMLDILLPERGCIVAFAEVYMDESYQDDSSILCIAGYLFRRQHAKQFAKSWGPYLNKKKGLPHFHMTDCAACQDIFKPLGRVECIEIATRLIAETKKWTTFGFAVTVDRELFETTLAGRHGIADTPYAFALLSAMIMVRNWRKRSGFDGEISYFFEDGHESRDDAEKFLSWIFKSEANRAKYGYRNHAFLPKSTHWLHPADMLAWHWRLENVRRRTRPRAYPVRKDLLALIRPHDMTMTYDAEEIAGLRAEMDANFGGKTLVR